MKLTDIKAQARKMGIKAGKVSKVDLIHEIQRAEGNTPCYGTAGTSCDQMECSWRIDCLGGK